MRLEVTVSLLSVMLWRIACAAAAQCAITLLNSLVGGAKKKHSNVVLAM